jgi:predicted methyltransferase
MNTPGKFHSKRFKLGLLSSLCLAGVASVAPIASMSVLAADAEKATRPEVDTAADADRKPADMVKFAQIKPGQVVIDYLPGRAYFTRVFSDAVGEKGTVYAVVPQAYLDRFKDRPRPTITTEPGRGNVKDATASGGTLGVPVKADVVWTSRNYHDVRGNGAAATAELNKAAFDALKSGGYYIVLDHSGKAGLDEEGLKKLHRIDEEMVKKEVLAAGFKLDAESDVLRHTADTREAAVFDGSVRGKTDQFILRFKKP